jgi:hypothetical protein
LFSLRYQYVVMRTIVHRIRGRKSAAMRQIKGHFGQDCDLF